MSKGRGFPLLPALHSLRSDPSGSERELPERIYREITARAEGEGQQETPEP